MFAGRRGVREGGWGTLARALAGCVRSPRISLGIACYITLTVAAFQYPTFGVALPAGSVADFRPLGYSLPGLVNAAAFLAIGLVWAGRRIEPRGVRCWAVTGACVTAGILTCWAFELFNVAMSPSVWVACLLCDLLIGAGVAVLSIGWVRELAGLSSPTAAATLVVAVAIVAAELVGTDILTGVGLAPVAGLALTWGAALLLPRKRGRRAAGADRPSGIHVPWKLMASIVFQGLTVGIMQTSIIAGGDGLLVVEATGMLLSGAIAAVALLVLRLDFNHLMYLVGFPLMALGQVCLALFGPDSAGVLVHEVGYRFVMAMSWVIAAWTVRHRDVSAAWIWPCIMVSFTFGRFAGSLAGDIPASLFNVSIDVALPVTASFCVLLAALVLFDDNSPRTAWGTASAAPDETEASSAFERACVDVAREAGLSPRESEMLAYLARGRNVDYISRTLQLSKDTVKTHRRNIYRKVDVHSQQDLVSLVEQTRDAVAAGSVRVGNG